MEMSRGKIESWPVHPVAESTSNLSLGQVHRPKSVTHGGKRKPASRADAEQKIVPKPKFLEQLEEYLQRELQTLSCPLQGPDLLRLQAYREVFEYLMEDFKTYKPLLAAIKNEYELVIHSQQDQIRKLQPLEVTLGTVEEECERKIMAMKQEEKSDVFYLQQENKHLCRVIDQANENKALLQAQVDKLSDELSQAYKKYRDEADARKLLISDINEMHFRQQDTVKSKVDEDDDPVLLKLLLNRAREDLKRSQSRLSEVLADYQDVVPRNEFTTLEQMFANLQEEHNKVKGDYKTLMQEHNTLLGVHKEVIAQRDKYAQESEVMKRSSTPRPDWQRCGEFIEGGMDHWCELTEGRTSDEMLDILISQLTNTDLEDIQPLEYFEGQGMSEDMPKHLQFEGQVRNRKLNRKDTMLFVEELWHERDRLQTSGEELEAFPEFFFSYLQQRFFEKSQVAEWGYNIQDACDRLGEEDQRIGLFGDILNGEVDEEVYHQQVATVKMLIESLDADSGEKDTISKDQLVATLSSIFPAKPQAAIDALMAISEEQQQPSGSADIGYKKLLLEDAASTSPFLDLLRRQEKAERSEFVAEIVQAFKGKT
jgi:hypothetical protein